MEGYLKLFFIVITVIQADAFTTKTGALLIPEKIIGGVIDIVQSHKNKPILGIQQTSQQTNFQQPNYQQYPQYAQTNAQGQGFYQNQQTSQGQYQQNGFQNGYQNGNYQTFPTGQNFQGQNSGQYQSQYPSTQFNQPTSMQFQNNGQSNQFQNSNGQSSQYQNNGQSNQFQSSNSQSSQYQNGQSNQYQNQQSNQGSQSNNQYQGSSHTQNTQIGYGDGSHTSQGVLVPGQPGNGQGPTCVCQAWTKPQLEKLSDPIPDKIEKSE